MSRAAAVPGWGWLTHGRARVTLVEHWLGPAGLAALLVVACLGPWLNLSAAIRVAPLAVAASVLGLLILRASSVAAPSMLTHAVLGLVVAAAMLVLGVVGFAALAVPITSVTAFALIVPIGGVAALAARRGIPAGQNRAPEVSAPPSAAPSRAVLVGAALLCAPALLVLPLLYGAVLVAFAGTMVLAFWDRDEDSSSTPQASRLEVFHLPAVSGLLPIVPGGLLLLLLATRLAPFLRSPVPLGYDTGLYRWVQDEFVAALPGFPEFAQRSWADVQPPGLFALIDLLHLAGATADARLWGLLILSQIIAATGIWLLTFDAGGRRAANWGLLLFALSSAQFTLYYQVHFKQIIVLALLPYALWLWRRGSWLAVPVGATIAATHTMGFLLLGLVLASDVLLPGAREEQEAGARSLPSHLLSTRGPDVLKGFVILVIGLASYTFAPDAITQFISTDVSESLASFGIGGTAGEGSFRLDTGAYAATVCVLLPFAAITLLSRWSDPRLRLVLLWAAWAGAFVVFRLVFERRFIASLDPALIVLASVAIAQVTARARQGWTFALIAVGASGAMLAQTAADLGPAIDHEDLHDLEVTSASLPADSYLMAVSGRDTPWVRSFAGRDTIAPGFLEHDRWTREEWDRFWSPTTAPRDRYALMARFERPVYVFMRPNEVLASLEEDPAFERISRTLWQYHPPTEGTESVATPAVSHRSGW